MADKRASAQKRAKQNRNQRAALEARTKGEAPKRPSRVAPSTADKLASKSRDTDENGSGSTSSSGSGDKPRRQRPPRPGDVPVDLETLQGSWFQKVRQVPGGSQVIQAGIMTVVCSAMLIFMKMFPSDAEQAKADLIKDYKPKADSTLVQAVGGPRAALYIGLPLLAAALALTWCLRPQRRRVWMVAAMVVALFSVGTGMLLYIVVAGFLGFAVYKAYRVEGPLKSRIPALDEDTSEEDGVRT